MYYMLTTEPGDGVVMKAVNAIIDAEGAIPGPNGNYTFITPDQTLTHGDGGTNSAILVVVAHASPQKIGGCTSWRQYQKRFNGVDWKDARTVYVAACSTAAGDPDRFVYGSIAQEVKSAFPNATVWASTTTVGSRTQAGDWEIVT